MGEKKNFQLLRRTGNYSFSCCDAVAFVEKIVQSQHCAIRCNNLTPHDLLNVV
jgi:hypothetical protein